MIEFLWVMSSEADYGSSRICRAPPNDSHQRGRKRRSGIHTRLASRPPLHALVRRLQGIPLSVYRRINKQRAIDMIILVITNGIVIDGLMSKSWKCVVGI